MTGKELLAAYAAGRREFRGADLSYADLAGADLSDANLSCAKLTGANLTGANLTGANLLCADLPDGIRWIGSGYVGRYRWSAVARDGTVFLRYGCEEHSVDAWESRHDALAQHHCYKDGARVTRALCAFVRALAAEAQ